VCSSDLIAKLMSNPRTSAYFAQPDFKAKIEMIKSNPSLLPQFLQDQKIMDCLSVVLGLDAEMTGAKTPPTTTSTSSSSSSSSNDTSSHHHHDEHAGHSHEHGHEGHSHSHSPSSSASSATTSTQKPATTTTTTTATTKDENKMDVDESSAVPAEKAKALSEKELGATAYKAKNFEDALKHFQAAHDLDPTDMVYLNNKGATYFEMKDFENCIKTTLQAVEIGIENRADYTIRAKAYARIARAHLALEQFEEAIRYMDKSLTEHRSPEIAKLKQQTERC